MYHFYERLFNRAYGKPAKVLMSAVIGGIAAVVAAIKSNDPQINSWWPFAGLSGMGMGLVAAFVLIILDHRGELRAKAAHAPLTSKWVLFSYVVAPIAVLFIVIIGIVVCAFLWAVLNSK